MRINKRVDIQPIGEVDSKILETFSIRLELVYQKTELLNSIPVISSAFNSEKDQYLSNDFLKELDRIRNTGDEILVIGVTNVDLYTHSLNFVFGQAELPGHCAVISIFRLHHDRNELFYNRMLKEAVHELGHTLGLKHCPDIHCVMHFSNSLEDTDIKSESYCGRCEANLKTKGYINI